MARDNRGFYVVNNDVPIGDVSEAAHIEVEHGGGGGPLEPGMSMKDYVDARCEAVESRLESKLDRLPTKGTLWAVTAAIIGGIFTAVAIVLGSLSFASDRFNGGLSISPAIAAVQSNQQTLDREQDTKIKVMDDKLDIIIKQTAMNK